MSSTGPDGAPERVQQVWDDLPHPSGNDRFAVYAVTARGRWRLAETSEDGIGMTLRTLSEEKQITDDSRVGIFDRKTRRWIVNPWAKGGRDAGQADRQAQ